MTGSAQKCPNMVKMGQKGPKPIYHERLVAHTWLTPHFDQKYHVSIHFSFIPYLSDDWKSPKITKNGQ